MNRRRFFKLLAGVAGALALPVPKALEYWWSPSISVRDWRWAVRVTHIDVTKLTAKAVPFRKLPEAVKRARLGEGA